MNIGRRKRGWGPVLRAQALCGAGLSLCALLCAAGDQVTTRIRSLAAAVPPSASPAPMTRRLDGRSLPARPRLPPTTDGNLPDFEFRDTDAPAARLAQVRSGPMLTLWQGRRIQVYLGIDKKGLAGLHFRQHRGPAVHGAFWRSGAASDRDTQVKIPPAAPRSVVP
jgi:hypothetical protein